MTFLCPSVSDKGIFKPIQDNVRARDVKDKHTIMMLLLLSSVIILLNIPRFFIGNYWLDEICSINVTKLDFSEIIHSDSMHPPLYYLVLTAVTRILGTSFFTINLTNLLMCVFLLILCSTVVYMQFGKIAALIMIILCTCLSSSIVQMREVRMYEMGVLFTLCAFLSFYCILQYDRKIDWICFVVSSLLVANTFYYSLLAVAFLYLVLLIFSFSRKEERKNDYKRIVVAIVVSVICFLPTLTLLLHGLSHASGNFWIKEWDVFGFIEYLFNGIGVIFVPLMILLCAYILNKNRSGKKNNGLDTIRNAKFESIFIVGGLLAVFGTIAVVLIMSIFTGPLFCSRHSYPFSCIAWLLLAFCISRINFDSIRKYVPVIVIVSIVFASASLGTTVINENMKWNSTLNILENTQEIGNGKVVITDIDNFRHGNIMVSHYYPGATTYYSVNLELPHDVTPGVHWIFLDNHPISQNTIDELGQHGCGAEFVVSGNFAFHYDVYVYRVVSI